MFEFIGRTHSSFVVKIDGELVIGEFSLNPKSVSYDGIKYTKYESRNVFEFTTARREFSPEKIASILHWLPIALGHICLK